VDLREIPTGTFQRHPWERARARFFLRTLAASKLLEKRLDVLDVGAGDGYFANELGRRLPEGSRVVCCDSNYSDAQVAQLEGTVDTRVVSFVRALPPAKFGLLLLLDVIEHVPDDAGFIRMLMTEHLAAGGQLLISVPAWMSLFTKHDLGVAHYRRYRPAQLVRLMESSGLEVRASGGLFHSLLVPRALEKLRERASGVKSAPAPDSPPDAQTQVASWGGGAVVTTLVDSVLTADNAISSVSAKLGLSLPGLSTWVLAASRAV
jgi:2-polyprenyl-3-methyl-5-hydroxy-6-metoxy-1,4-benzoquinol methylase